MQQRDNAVLRYSGLAFQMGATIAVCVWAGKEIDGYFSNRIPAATISFSLLGIGAALYSVIKETKTKS